MASTHFSGYADTHPCIHMQVKIVDCDYGVVCTRTTPDCDAFLSSEEAQVQNCHEKHNNCEKHCAIIQIVVWLFFVIKWS